MPYFDNHNYKQLYVLMKYKYRQNIILNRKKRSNTVLGLEKVVVGIGYASFSTYKIYNYLFYSSYKFLF